MSLESEYKYLISYAKHLLEDPKSEDCHKLDCLLKLSRLSKKYSEQEMSMIEKFSESREIIVKLMDNFLEIMSNEIEKSQSEPHIP